MATYTRRPVKKCNVCTKDLPDAALHCVFCGGKQPSPESQAQNLRTVMGYSSSNVIDELKRVAAAGPAALGAPAAGAPPAALIPERARTAPPLQPQVPQQARSGLSIPPVAPAPVYAATMVAPPS